MHFLHIMVKYCISRIPRIRDEITLGGWGKVQSKNGLQIQIRNVILPYSESSDIKKIARKPLFLASQSYL
jgi:hypothetical protein